MNPPVRRASRLLATALACIAWTLVASCAGGGGSDVPNDLSGTVLSASGEPAGGTRVFLRSARATPGQPGRTWETTSDLRGEFHLPLPADTGTWILEWRDSASRSGTTRILRSEWIASERIPPVRLAPWGGLRGTVSTTSSQAAAKMLVTIPGLLRSSPVDSNGTWRIDELPEGAFQPGLEGGPGATASMTDSVTVHPGREDILPPVVAADRPDRRIWNGLLLGWDHRPVPLARLWLISPDGRDSIASNSVSDDSGRISWILPDTGRGVVRLSTATSGWTGSVQFSDPAGPTLPDTVVMQTLATLSGTFLPGAGPGVPRLAGFSVRIGSIGRLARVGSDGLWTFDRLPLGTWSLTIEDSQGKVLDSLQASAATFGFPTIGPMVVGPAPELGWTQLLCLDRQGKAIGGCLATTYPDSAWRSFNQAQRTSLLETNFSWTTTADPLGRFAVARQSRQGSHLSVRSTDRRLGAFLALPAESTFPTLPALDTVRNLRVALSLPASAPAEWSLVGFRLVLVGTGRYSPVLHGLEKAVFDSLPPGAYRLIAVPAATDIPLAAEWMVKVEASDVDTVLSASHERLEDSLQWKAIGDISLEVPASVLTRRDIPVRVVLDGRVDMASGKPDGSDLRIFGPDGQPARFWVSHWDPATSRAEVWIRADSLQGGRTLSWKYRQGNPRAAALRQMRVDSVFLAKDWLALWEADSGRSLVAGGYPFRGNWGQVSSGPLAKAFVLGSSEYLEAAIPPVGGDTGCTFLASFRFDTLPAKANLVRVSGSNATRYLAIDSSSGHPTFARLVWGERFTDTVFGQSGAATDAGNPGDLSLATSLAIAVNFGSSQTTAQRLEVSPSLPGPPAVLTTSSMAGDNLYLEVGRFGRSGGFAGAMTFPRLSRGILDADRLALEAFNLQEIPSWIQVVRHGSVTAQSKNP